MTLHIDVTVHVHLHDSAQLDRVEGLVGKLINLGDKSMSAISDFAAKQKSYNDRLDTAVQGLTDDVKTLNEKITALQNSSGAITPEDQALLDDLQNHGETLASKLEALDGLTPPAPPADTGGGGTPPNITPVP